MSDQRDALRKLGENARAAASESANLHEATNALGAEARDRGKM